MAFLDPSTPPAMAAQVASAFAAAHGREAAVVAQAPGRVNLIGEHTDYNAGLCLPVALPHATYAAAGRRDDGRFTLRSAHAAEAWEGEAGDLPRATGWAAYVAGVLWALAEDGVELPGLDLVIDSTVPVGAGLSSSAAIECSVGVAVLHLLGSALDPADRERLITACIRAETEVAGAPTGGLDQTIALLAEPGAALLLDFDDHSRRVVPLGLADAGLTLLVVDTTVRHALVDGGYAARRADCEEVASRLGVPSLRHASLEQVAELPEERLRRRAHHVITEIDRVERAVEAVAVGDWAQVGRLFAASHASLRDDYEVSCAELDAAVTAAVGAGALGARMTGGGFGGSVVALVPADALDVVADRVAADFADRAFAPPRMLVAEPSGAAHVC